MHVLEDRQTGDRLTDRQMSIDRQADRDTD